MAGQRFAKCYLNRIIHPFFFLFFLANKIGKYSLDSVIRSSYNLENIHCHVIRILFTFLKLL